MKLKPGEPFDRNSPMFADGQWLTATMTRRNELAPGGRVAIAIDAAHVVPLED